ncbi:MAG: rhodanese-like domain-containing protein [Desulfobacterales bacterium]|nr:MAG: rhodanese-like domain-containing protein [Desulfobacterales bacterium]
MGWTKIVKDSFVLVGISVVAAFSVNFFSPVGIALVGRWDDRQGVVSARAKTDSAGDALAITDVKVAKQIHDSGKALFVDARSRDDYEEGHIQGAVSLPVGQFDEAVEAFLEQYPSEGLIVTYCSGRACDDSHRLAQLLLALGYPNVRVFIDGYPGWEAERYPVE